MYWGRTKAHFVKRIEKLKKSLFHQIWKIGQGKGPFHQNTETKNSKLSGRQNITYQNFPDRVCKLFSQQKRAKSAQIAFQIVRYLPNLSTFVAIGLSSNHLWIFKLWVLRQIFPHSSHFQVFKWGVVRQFFPHSSQLICHPIICEFSKCALVAKSFHIHRN